MYHVSGLRKERKNKNKNESTGHVAALDTTESCLLEREREERSYVVAEKP